MGNVGSSKLLSAGKTVLGLCVLVAFGHTRCDAPTLGTSIDVGKQKRTLADVRTLATAILMYGIDHKSFPATTSVTSLQELVEPEYLRKTPTRDAWGHEFRYVAWQQGVLSRGPDRFVLASPGKDGRWETDDPRGYTPKAIADFAADLVYIGNLTSTGYPETRFIRAPDWELERARAYKTAAEALASAVSLNTLALLQHEVDWAEREWEMTKMIAPHQDEFRRELGELRARTESFDPIVPSTPQIDTYRKFLAGRAELAGVSIHSFDLQIVQRDRYQEITIDIEVRGTKENAELFRTLVYNGGRLASLGEAKFTDSTARFSISLFVLPPVNDVQPRQCRPIEGETLSSDVTEVEHLKSRLESLCKKLYEWRELRSVAHQYKQHLDRLRLGLDLVHVYHPETRPPD